MNAFIFSMHQTRKSGVVMGLWGKEKKMCSRNKTCQASKLQLKPSTATGTFLGSSCLETGFQKLGVELQCSL